MNHHQFDTLARSLATGRSRRSALKGGALAVAGTALGAKATLGQGTPTAEGLAENGATLFVQTAAGGTFLPNTLASPESGFHGDYLLTLSGHSGQTIGFTDRPQRDFGQVETASFIEQLGFSQDNPPNAAIVTTTPDGVEDILVVELFNPAYDANADLLLYEANILGEYAGDGLAPVVVRQDDDALATEFAHVSLFIDDCPIVTSCFLGDDLACWHTSDHRIGPFPSGAVDLCWSWKDLQCNACDGRDWGDLNTECFWAYQDRCQDGNFNHCCAG